MKRQHFYLLATLTLTVGFALAQESEDTNEYVLVKRGGEYCLVTQMSGHEVPWCDSHTMKPPMRERLELAKKVEADRFERVMQPNPLTPKFNACVAHVRDTGEFMYVNHGCRSPLFEDVRALEGFFSRGERALDAQRSGEIRLAEMSKIEKQIKADRLADAARRRHRQTPLENAIDKLREPCTYADSENRMRLCD